jgi:ABC-type sulfate transport system permease subunit
MSSLTLVATSSSSPSSATLLIYAVLILINIVALWRVFQKAGEPGWAAIIPFYSTYVLLRIVGRPGWWLILFFIPLVNIVISIVVAVYLAKAFGKGPGFAVGLIFLPFIFCPILGFGSAKYEGAPQ